MEAMRYASLDGGKRIRPFLVTQSAGLFAVAVTPALRTAAALEMIHTATLVHDDMIDGGEVRRGTPTPHVRFGNSTAILLGDFFYTRAFDLVAGLGDVWMTKSITKTTNIICEGELLQMIAQRDAGVSRAEYDRIIYAKTAVLCEPLASWGPPMATMPNARPPPNTVRPAASFQIVDDCLDLVGDPKRLVSH